MLDRRFLDVSLVVQDIANEPAANPTVGTQYIVGENPTGAFEDIIHGYIARYDGTKWISITPKAEGLEVLNAKTGELLTVDERGHWVSKVTLSTKNDFPFKFYIPDYAVEYKDGSPTNISGHTAGDIQIDGSGNKIYVANSEGTFEDKTSEFKGNTLFFWRTDNNNSYPELWTWDGADIQAIFPNDGDYLFDKGECQFYTYKHSEYKFQKVNALTPSETLQIEGGDLFYNDEDKSFYFISAKGCAKFNAGGSGGAGSEFISPVLDIVQKGEHSNPPRPVAGLKFIDVNEGSAFAYDDSLNLSSITLTHGDRYALTTDFKIYEYDGTTWTATDVPDGGIFLNKADNYVYVYDAKAGAFVKASVDTVSGAGDEVICENHTLTAEEATAKSFTLANSIKTGKETGVLLSVCGMIQIPGVDYTASGNTISWTGKTLDDIGLQAGDIFVVQYVKG